MSLSSGMVLSQHKNLAIQIRTFGTVKPITFYMAVITVLGLVENITSLVQEEEKGIVKIIYNFFAGNYSFRQTSPVVWSYMYL